MASHMLGPFSVDICYLFDSFVITVSLSSDANFDIEFVDVAVCVIVSLMLLFVLRVLRYI